MDYCCSTAAFQTSIMNIIFSLIDSYEYCAAFFHTRFSFHRRPTQLAAAGLPCAAHDNCGPSHFTSSAPSRYLRYHISFDTNFTFRLWSIVSGSGCLSCSTRTETQLAPASLSHDHVSNKLMLRSWIRLIGWHVRTSTIMAETVKGALCSWILPFIRREADATDDSS